MAGPDDRVVPAMRDMLDAARLVKAAYGAPGEHGYGWDYMPGRTWVDGFTPRRLQDDPDHVTGTGRHLAVIDEPGPRAEFLAQWRPFSREAQAAVDALGSMTDPAPEDYVRSFLARFGADIGRPVLWTDPAGVRVPISERYFQNERGEWKVGKRERASRLPFLAEALIDPDEIWLGLIEREGQVLVDRRYLRAGEALGAYVVMEMGRRWWREVTAFVPDRAGHPNLNALDARRGGKLIWRRK